LLNLRRVKGRGAESGSMHHVQQNQAACHRDRTAKAQLPVCHLAQDFGETAVPTGAGKRDQALDDQHQRQGDQ